MKVSLESQTESPTHPTESSKIHHKLKCRDEQNEASDLSAYLDESLGRFVDIRASEVDSERILRVRIGLDREQSLEFTFAELLLIALSSSPEE